MQAKAGSATFSILHLFSTRLYNSTLSLYSTCGLIEESCIASTAEMAGTSAHVVRCLPYLVTSLYSIRVQEIHWSGLSIVSGRLPYMARPPSLLQTKVSKYRSNLETSTCRGIPFLPKRYSHGPKSAVCPDCWAGELGFRLTYWRGCTADSPNSRANIQTRCGTLLGLFSLLGLMLTYTFPTTELKAGRACWDPLLRICQGRCNIIRGSHHKTLSTHLYCLQSATCRASRSWLARDIVAIAQRSAQRQKFVR